jgi:hypothetical protein
MHQKSRLPRVLRGAVGASLLLVAQLSHGAACGVGYTSVKGCGGGQGYVNVCCGVCLAPVQCSYEQSSGYVTTCGGSGGAKQCVDNGTQVWCSFTWTYSGCTCPGGGTPAPTTDGGWVHVYEASGTCYGG